MIAWEHENGVRGVWDITLAPDLYLRSDYYTNDERWEVTGRRGLRACQPLHGRGIQQPSLEVYADGEITSYHDLDDDWGSSFRDSGRHWLRWLRTGEGPLLVERRGGRRRAALRARRVREQRGAAASACTRGKAGVVHAWRVHRHGEPGEVFQLDEIPAPTAADLEGLGMHMSGWVPVQPGIEPFGDWVILQMTFAALALPDVTMARGSYPVPVAMPYVSGQEGVGVVTDASPIRRDLLGTARCRGVHPAVREPGAGLGRHLDDVRGARLDVRRGRGRVHDPRAHRVARGAPSGEDPGG